MTETVEHDRWISGFWRRLIAFFLDTLFLALVGFLLGLFFKEVFVQLGQWGFLVGFLVSLIYFSVGNSTIANGQTFGKRGVHIQVVDAENKPIGLGRSISRYLVLGMPFYLSSLQFLSDMMGSFLSYIIGILVFGGYFTIVYLFVFNRATRQSLHDLVVGTYVVHENTEKQPADPVWKGHFVVFALLVVAAISLTVFNNSLIQTKPFEGMNEVRIRLSDEAVVSHSTITSGLSTFKPLGEAPNQSRFVTAQIFLNENLVDDESLARHLAELVVEHYPQAREKDVMLVTLVHGYSIGIWSQWSSKTYRLKPGEILGSS